VERLGGGPVEDVRAEAQAQALALGLDEELLDDERAASLIEVVEPPKDAGLLLKGTILMAQFEVPYEAEAVIGGSMRGDGIELLVFPKEASVEAEIAPARPLAG
jgi:hypothetical protein